MTALRTGPLVRGQFQGLVHGRHVRIIPPLWTGTAGLLPPAPLRRRRLLLTFQMIGALRGRLFFAFTPKELSLQLRVRAAELFDFLLQLLKPPQRLSMHALPIADLLSQLEVLPPQPGHRATQGGTSARNAATSWPSCATRAVRSGGASISRGYSQSTPSMTSVFYRKSRDAGKISFYPNDQSKTGSAKPGQTHQNRQVAQLG